MPVALVVAMAVAGSEGEREREQARRSRGGQTSSGGRSDLATRTTIRIGDSAESDLGAHLADAGHGLEAVENESGPMERPVVKPRF